MQEVTGMLYSQEGYQALDNTGKTIFVKEKLIKYLPVFVNLNSYALNIILGSVAAAIVKLYDAAYSLQNASWAGKGLRLTADEHRLFYKQSDTEEEIQNRLINRFSILKTRGTEQGIINDLASLDYTIVPQLQFLSSGGWTLDESFPETDNLVFLDVEKIAKLNFSYIGALGSAVLGISRLGDQYFNYVKDYTAKIKQYIMPADVTTIYE